MKKMVGKALVVLIAICGVYRTIVEPPIYYRDIQGAFVTKPLGGKYESPIVNFDKLLSELIGMGILAGTVYFLLLQKEKS